MFFLNFARNRLSRGVIRAKTQFSDHLGSASKFHNLLLITKISNIIPHFRHNFFCIVTILLLKPKKAIFCLFLGLCQNSEKIRSATPTFSSISWILMMFWANIPGVIEIRSWEPSQKKLSIFEIHDFEKSHLIEYAWLIIWL